MRRLPIDTSAVAFTVAVEPRPVLDFDTKAPKLVDGAALSSLNLVAQSPDEISIINVKVPGLSGVFKIGDSVQVVGLSAIPWVNNGKDGVSFNADGVSITSKVKAA